MNHSNNMKHHTAFWLIILICLQSEILIQAQSADWQKAIWRKPPMMNFKHTTTSGAPWHLEWVRQILDFPMGRSVQ